MRRSQKTGIRKAKGIKSAHGRTTRYRAEMKKMVMKRWATNPTSIITSWSLLSKEKQFMAYWCQWFPKAKVTTRWNKCKNQA